MAKKIIGKIIGGVNYEDAPSELGFPYLVDAQNLVPSPTGDPTKRGGSSVLNSVAYGTYITSFHEYINAGTSYKFASQGTVIGLFDGASTFDNHITGLTSGKYGQWLNYGSYAIYVNGTDNAQKTDGTTGNDLTSDLSGIPGGRCIAEWGERVWIGGYTSNIARLTGSALRAETDFSTSTTDIGFFQGYIGDKNNGITGLIPFFDMLVIGKLNQIYMLTGAPETASSTFRIQPLYSKDKDNIGFTAKNAITQVGNDIIFLDGFDIKAISNITQYGDVESTTILANVRDFFKSSSGASLDKDYLQDSHFFNYKQKEQVWCSIPTGQYTRYWFILDYSNRELKNKLGLPLYSFLPMSGLTPISFGGVIDGTYTKIYMGCDDGKVRLLDTGTNDTSTAIDAFGVWGYGDPDRFVQAMRVNLNIGYTTACTLTPSYAYGLQDWASIRTAGNYTAMSAEDLTDSSWITKGNAAIKRFNEFYGDMGRSFCFKLRHNTASQTFDIKPSTIHLNGRVGYYA
jgi:hypothetical protein